MAAMKREDILSEAPGCRRDLYPTPGVCPGGLGGPWNNVGLPEMRHTDAKRQ